MPSTFVQHHTKALIDIGVFPPSTSTTATRRTLSSLLLSLKSPPTISQIYDATTYLERNSTSASDVDEIVLKKLILDKLVVGVYAETLDTYLLEAIAVETEAEWWADIEHSNRLSVAYYLLQSESILTFQAFLLMMPSSSSIATGPVNANHITHHSYQRHFSPTVTLHTRIVSSSISIYRRPSSECPCNSNIPSPSAPQTSGVYCISALISTITCGEFYNDTGNSMHTTAVSWA